MGTTAAFMFKSRPWQQKHETEARRQRRRIRKSSPSSSHPSASCRGRKEDANRLCGELRAIGKKVDDASERITGLGERVTRLDRMFEVFSGIVLLRVLPPPNGQPADEPRANAASGANPAGKPQSGVPSH